MAAKNDITGDSIQTRTVTDTYRDNYDKIFGKKKQHGTPATDAAIRDVHTTPVTGDDQPQNHAGQEPEPIQGTDR